MMKTARVAVDSLNVRNAPVTGDIRYQLHRGDRLNVIREVDGWLEISRPESPCWVKGAMAEMLGVPGEITANEISVSGKKLMLPDGTSFAKLFKLGAFNSGKTKMEQFIAANPGLFATMKPSLVRVARAVSINEGALEAINTWDSAFLSFGIFQWTSGPGSDAGELPAMLARLAREDADAYAFYFGKYGLDLEMPATPAALPTGKFRLGGDLLSSPAKKGQLRSPIWAYRFWRAGHDPAIRKAEIGHALDRIGAFYDKTSTGLKNKRVRDWVSSELGVAQLLDQHVNRPGHVIDCVAAAIAKVLNAGAPANPSGWGDAQEAALLKHYLEIRATFGSLPMTNSTARADEIAKAVAAGKLSAKRNSFDGF